MFLVICLVLVESIEKNDRIELDEDYYSAEDEEEEETNISHQHQHHSSKKKIRKRTKNKKS